jgi:hypothetical protein
LILSALRVGDFQEWGSDWKCLGCGWSWFEGESVGGEFEGT